MHDPQLVRDSRREVAARRRERQISELAQGQHGLVTRGQLLALGFNTHSIQRRIARGHLHPVHRGVYAVGHRILTVKGRWMAAVLAGGDGAALSHRPAGAHLGLGTAQSRLIDVTAPTRRTSRGGIRVHTASLPADEVTVHDGIPVTTAARTLLDLASVLDREHLEQAVAKAEELRLADSPSLPELIERYPKFRGRKNLRAVLGDRLGRGVARSELEVRFQRFLRAHALPLPEMNVWLQVEGEWRQVDCVWRDPGVVAELDSRAHHLDAAAFESDRARDQALLAAGWRCMRITWKQLHSQPDRLAGHLRSVLDERAVTFLR